MWKGFRYSKVGHRSFDIRIDFGHDSDIEIADFGAASMKRISHGGSSSGFAIEVVLELDGLVGKHTEK